MSHWEASGKSDEWYTPRMVFEALEERFDLDVAGRRVEANCVPANFSYDADSLNLSWSGFVWMNPPFGGRNCLEPWLEKFFDHGNGIALTPDRTSAPWFRNNWKRADLVMFTPKMRFLRPDGTEGKSPSNGTSLWAIGDRAYVALVRAELAGLGILAKPR